MSPSRAEQAARNNAVWCDTVCRAHGVPGELAHGLWLQRRPGPPHYPNLVTLREGDTEAAAGAAILSLAATLPGAGWGVKDSFCALDLGARGFDLLFNAQWIWREPERAQAVVPGLRWAAVHTDAEQQRWEVAWAAGGLAASPPLFPPTLRHDPTVCFLAGWRGDEIVAGGILNRSDAVVGVSNLFAAGVAPAAVFAAVAGLAQSRCPGLPLVGYESGDWLLAAQACGFVPCGPLRVWLRRPAS